MAIWDRILLLQTAFRLDRILRSDPALECTDFLAGGPGTNGLNRLERWGGWPFFPAGGII